MQPDRTTRLLGPAWSSCRVLIGALALCFVVSACSSNYGFEQQAAYDGLVATFVKDAGAIKDGKGAELPGSGKADGELADADSLGDLGEDGVPGSDTDDSLDASIPGPDGCSSSGCTVDSDCPVSAGSCEQPSCQEGCCVAVVATDGAPCDDGNGCTHDDACTGGTCAGQATGCDDGLACTDDGCDAKLGKCDHKPAEGFCFIEGACYEDGVGQLGSDCIWCSIADSQTAWSLKPTCCKADSQCPALGACDEPHCDVASGKCMPQKKLGCCTTDADCDDANACTADSCDVASGNCLIVPKNCPAPNGCQTGACNPGTGACGAETKPGWCYVEGQCVVDGSTADNSPCQVCDSVKDKGKWTSPVGSLCDDGEKCTFSDACTAAGECKGTPQPGCCKADTDCAPPNSPCQTVKCNASAGLCLTGTKAACCTSGVCCDLFAHGYKAAKTSCADSVLATEYQCVGTVIQKREITPGCNGSAADGCTSDPTFTATGAWQNVKDCGSGSACQASGSGQMPTCKAVAQCSSGECCDLGFGKYKLKGAACGSSSFKTQWQCSGLSVQKRTGQQTCTGTGTTCSSADADLQWSGWATTQTCGSGMTCSAAADGSSATCKAASVGSCAGKCGGSGSDGVCWCDSICVGNGDCCKDYVPNCCGTGSEATGACSCGANPAGSCKNKCGGAGSGSSGCYCDDFCDGFGDCCADKYSCNCP